MKRTGGSSHVGKCHVDLFFFLSEPVAFRRVYGLESYSRTSGESNRHRKSVSTTSVMPYQLHHEDDCHVDLYGRVAARDSLSADGPLSAVLVFVSAYWSGRRTKSEVGKSSRIGFDPSLDNWCDCLSCIICRVSLAQFMNATETSASQ